MRRLASASGRANHKQNNALHLHKTQPLIKTHTWYVGLYFVYRK